MASKKIFLLVMGLTLLTGNALIFTSKRAIDLGPQIGLAMFGFILIGAGFVAWKMKRAS